MVDGQCRVVDLRYLKKTKGMVGGNVFIRKRFITTRGVDMLEGGLCDPRPLYSGGNQVPNTRNNESDDRMDGRFQLGLASNRLPPLRIQM